jgi:hypothetical protein
VTKRRSVERIGRVGVGVESPRVKDVALVLGTRTNENVVVQMRFAVTVEAVGETDYPLPGGRLVSIEAATTISNDERALLEVLHGRAHGRSMGVDDATGVLRIDGEQHRNRSRRRDHEVVAHDGRTVARDEHARDIRRITGVTTPPQPPARSGVAQTVELVGGVVREIGDVVRTTRK